MLGEAGGQTRGKRAKQSGHLMELLHSNKYRLTLALSFWAAREAPKRAPIWRVGFALCALRFVCVDLLRA